MPQPITRPEREAARERDRKKYARNREHILARKRRNKAELRKVHQARWREEARKHRQKHPEKWMVYAAKQRAKRLGLPFDLTDADVRIPEVCPVLGIRLQKNDKEGPCDTSPTLDRIVPARGYVRGNVKVISCRANTIKSNATVDELLAVLRYVREGGQ